MIYKGKDIMLYANLNGVKKPFCHARNTTLSVDVDLIESTTRNNIRGKTYEYGHYSYTLSLDGLSTLDDDANFLVLLQAAVLGRKIGYYFEAVNNKNLQFFGNLLVPHIEIDSPHDAISSFKGTLQGDGDFSIMLDGVPVNGFNSVPVLANYNSVFNDYNEEFNGDFDITQSGRYTYTGNNGNANLPAPSNAIGSLFFIKNRQGTLTINAPGNIMFVNTLVNTFTLQPGDAVIINLKNGVYNVQ